ncbi:unnamed protein product [Pleuronectes platessa]|uniref:Uncharacterized protein n=1 Tax=Pleuronectes platessa TaxID=8262 RepID=A0A9N7UE48_PLEPL|nr:unnamed protein product [Pleuronectes platessa]
MKSEWQSGPCSNLPSAVGLAAAELRQPMAGSSVETTAERSREQSGGQQERESSARCGCQAGASSTQSQSMELVSKMSAYYLSEGTMERQMDRQVGVASS